MGIELRHRVPGSEDDDAHFRWQADPIQAATTVPSRARAEFDEWVDRVDSDPTTTMRMIYRDGELVGTISIFPLEDGRYIGYRIGNEFWGRGIATEAVRLMLLEDLERPLFATVMLTNVASVKALERNGFRLIIRHDGDDPDGVFELR